MSVALPQSTPEVPLRPCRSALTTPTPMIEPINVCDDEAGMPSAPRAEVPDDGGDEQREDHGEAGAGADLQDQLDRQQRDDAEGDGAGRHHHAEEIENPDQTTATFAGIEWV